MSSRTVCCRTDVQRRTPYDIFSRLLNDRIVFLGEEVNSTSRQSRRGTASVSRSAGPRQGHPDVYQQPPAAPSRTVWRSTTRCSISSATSTICVGMAASMGAFLLSSGATQGKRIALPNAEIMIHQPAAGTQGKVTDMEIDVELFLLKIKARMNRIMAENTGKTREQIKADPSAHFTGLAEE